MHHNLSGDACNCVAVDKLGVAFITSTGGLGSIRLGSFSTYLGT